MGKLSLVSYVRAFLWKIAVLLGALSALQGCGGSTDASPQTVNDVYYQSLVGNNYLSHASAQAPVDLFVSVKHFDLGQDTSQMLAGAAATPSFVVYRPAHALVVQPNSPLLGSATDEIPGTKPLASIPDACQGLADEALKTCIEDSAAAGTPPVDSHMSHFDAQALRLLFGDGFDSALVSKVIDSNLEHVDSATRVQIASQLSDYINDAPAHRLLDLTRYNVFDRNGFYLSGVSFSDTSRGDVDGDGVLEPHSTMVIQLSKKIDYVRSGLSELDTTLQNVHGQLPAESYLINLQVFIHLKDLSGLRQRVAIASDDGTGPLTVAQELAQSDLKAQAKWINTAMDANILKKVVESPGLIPWASSEYVLSFQLSPENITQHLSPALTSALETGDLAAAGVIEQHMNAQTAIMTGAGNVAAPQSVLRNVPPVKVFYQVSQPRFGLARFSWAASDLEYGMYDAAGNRVAIKDPASAALILAGEPSTVLNQPATPQKIMLFTKSGACNGNTSNWAYWPSRVQTGRFGRGINWILTESLIHNQVGDYKNIHWYQSLWKATAQSAIKSGMWVLANYLKVQMGGAVISQNKSDYALYYILEVVMPYMNSYLSDQGRKEDGKVFMIAGYSYKVDAKVIRFLREGASYGKNDTFAQKAGSVIKGAAIGFLIDRVSDGVGQSIDVTVTGWQDYSDGSHYGCFKFD